MASVKFKQIWRCSRQVGRRKRTKRNLHVSSFLDVEDSDDVKGDGLRKKSSVSGGAIGTLIYVVLYKEVEVSVL